MGGAGPDGRRPESRRAGAGHDAPKEAKPPAAREMRGGQRSGVSGRERGGAGVGSVEWVQVVVEGGLLRDGVGDPESELPSEVLREPGRV